MSKKDTQSERTRVGLEGEHTRENLGLPHGWAVFGVSVLSQFEENHPNLQILSIRHTLRLAQHEKIEKFFNTSSGQRQCVIIPSKIFVCFKIIEHDCSSNPSRPCRVLSHFALNRSLNAVHCNLQWTFYRCLRIVYRSISNVQCIQYAYWLSTVSERRKLNSGICSILSQRGSLSVPAQLFCHW